MYIWMILATFIVVLATFNLSPRADIEKVQLAPLAEAAVTKFLSQHNAAVEYATKVTKEMLSGGVGFSGSVTQLTGCNNGVGDLCDYLPIGYHYTENAYYSSVYCLNGHVKDAEGNITKTAGQETEDCSTAVRYVITFGRVPQRWKNVSTNKILAPYYTALRSKIPMQVAGGIVIPKTEGDPRNVMNSNYVIQVMGSVQRFNTGAEAGSTRIQDFSIKDNSIPPYFLAYDTNFTGKCLHGGGLDPKFPCVIFVSKVEL